MDDKWDKMLDAVDWDAVDREVEKSFEEDRIYDELYDYFDDDSFDYKRSYLRKFMRKRPEITDKYMIDAATEQMLESHEGGVELDMDDAIRFVKDDKPMSVREIAAGLAKAGITADNIEDIVFTELDEDGEKYGTIKDPAVKKKAAWMTRYAYILDRNKDVMILGLPTYDHLSDWTQVKLAFFSEEMNAAEKGILKQLMSLADRYDMKEEHGVAVVVFQIFNIWSDFK